MNPTTRISGRSPGFLTFIRSRAVGLSGLVAIALCCVVSAAQQVQVSQGKGSVVLSVSAEKPYHLFASQEELPALSVQCAQKGKKDFHLLLFSTGGSVAEDRPGTSSKSAQVIFKITLGGTKQITTWIPYGDTATFAYYGKTEPDRVRFIQTLVSSPKVSIEFTPFLTGAPTVSVFDLSDLRGEMAKHPECGIK